MEYNNVYTKESNDFISKINQIINPEYNQTQNQNYTFRNQAPSENNNIKSLQGIIEAQRAEINRLKLEKNNLVCILDKKEILNKKLEGDINFLNEKLSSIEECYKNEIEKLKNDFNEEKEKIKKNSKKFLI